MYCLLFSLGCKGFCVNCNEALRMHWSINTRTFPCSISVALDEEVVAAIVAFVRRHKLAVINIAGHRENLCDGIDAAVHRVLTRALAVRI